MTINERIADMGGLMDGDLAILNVGKTTYALQSDTLASGFRDYIPVERLSQFVDVDDITYRTIAFSVLDHAYPDLGSIWILEV